MRRVVYIAGPMTGLPEHNYPEFMRAAKKLKDMGFAVVNPAEIGNGFGTPKELSQDKDLLTRLTDLELAIVRECDAICLLDGWEKSVGTKRELYVAIEHKLSIMQERDLG